MKKNNIVLIGFMGSGKSSVAKLLARRLKREAVSTDALIEKKEGRPIPEIFKDKGEAYFRRVEKDIVRGVSEQSGIIVDCGGGIVLDQDNIDHLKRNGTLIYLKASPEFLLQCIKNTKKRPLLNVDDPLGKIRELLKQRASKYGQADIILDTDQKTVAQICEDILKVIQ